MAVKARAEITLSSIRDVQSVTRYYLLQSSTSAVPSKPTTNPPGGDWVTSEPTYTSGSTNSLYFVDLTVFSDGTFAYSDVSLSSSYEAAKVAYNKADNAEDIAERATHSINLTPFGSRSFDDTDYWKNGFAGDGYTSSGTVWNTEQLSDGWIHFVCDTTGYTGTAVYSGDAVRVAKSQSIKPDTLYTILYEVRNNNSVLSSSSGNNSYFYIQESGSNQFWGNSATELLEGETKSGSFIMRTMAPEPNTVYRKRFTKMSDAGTNAGSSPTGLFQMMYRTGKGDILDFEFRVSLYEGRYLGDYMPYVISDVTDLSQIGGRNLYITKDAIDGCIDSSTGNISAMGVANREQVSDFIPVKAGDDLVFQAWAKATNTGSNTGSTWLGYAFYDSEKVYLGSRPAKYDGTLRADGFTHNYYKISVPEGASYIRCSYRRVLEGKAKLERGVVLTDWTQAPEDLESDISAANALAQSAKDTADGKITTFYAASTATPTATTVGDLWIKTDDGNSLWRWDGSAWVSVDNADIQSALTAAGTAQATADSKVVTFAQTSTPTATDIGDIWIDTDDNNRMYRWNGTAWVDVHDPQIAEANEKIDNLRIGGRNLLLNSEHFIPNSGIFSESVVTQRTNPAIDGELPYYASGAKYVKVTFPNITIGEQYAFSCEVARQSGGSSIPVYITINGEEAVEVGTATELVWTKFNVIFTATSSTTYAKVQVYTAASNGTSSYIGYFRNFKLERGNRATDWTPAPEDISDRIDENDARIKELVSDGANLIIGTTYPDVSRNETLPRIFGQTHATRYIPGATLSVAEHGFRATNNGTGYTYIVFGNSAASGLPPGMHGLVAGETYTLSADVTCKQLSNNTNTTTYYLRCQYYDDSNTTGTMALKTYTNVISITENDRGVEKSGRCEFTFTIQPSVTMCYIGFWCNRKTAAEFQAGDFIELRNLKLEKGRKATPWSSPVDWNAKILSSANGKNTNTYTTKSSTGVITYPADAVAGDLLFVAEYGSTVYTTLYRFNGTSWENTQIGGMAVTQLDAGNVVSGTMSASRIKGDTLTLGGANNVDGMLKVYDANGTLVGSFTREGLMAIAGTIGGWTINSSELTGEWQETYQHFESLLSPVSGLQFEETSTEPGFDAQFLNSIWYGTAGISFLRRRTVNNAVEQLSAFISADTNGGWDGSGREGQITISPHLRVDGTGIDTPHMRADASYAWDEASGSYIRQPAMIMAGSTTISTGTSSKRATICTIPVEYQTGWRIIPFVTRTYGNAGATPADAGDFYYAYYNSADHKVCVKLANVLASGTAYTFDYMIYAVPLT